MLYFWLPTL